MRNKGAILSLAVALALVCLYQLSFTWISSNKRSAAGEYANSYIKTLTSANSGLKSEVLDSLRIRKEDYYLDSLGSEVVYNIGIKKYTLRECQARELNFGLDLKGGMNIILEVSVVDILKNLSSNPTDPTFIKALSLAKEYQAKGNDDFITAFGKAFEEVDPNARLSALFNTEDFRDRIEFNSSNAKVIEVIREESKGAIDNAFNIISTRIDQFGVTQPTIQMLETNDRILVDLPGVRDKERVRKLLQGTANLEFWETYDNTELAQSIISVNEVVKNYNDTQKALQRGSSTVDSEVEVANDATETTQENDDQSLLAQVASDSEAADSAASLDDPSAAYPFFQYFIPALSRETGQPFQGPSVGTAHYRDTSKINMYLKMAVELNKFPRDVNFLWSAMAEKTDDGKESDYIRLYAIKRTGRDGRPPLDGDVITSASQEYDQVKGSAYVSMNMNGEGATKWARITAENIGQCIAIVMDNRVYSAPVVQGEITGGSSQISGSFSVNEATDLANLLKSGKLPAPARIIQETVVGPSLGEEAVNDGLKSFIIAFIVILVYMVLYYSPSAGLIADIALLTNMFFIIGVLASLGAALTLPGIAGIVLTIGMSVDANVLIYERIREEVAGGKGIKLAIKDGYKAAYSAILDANITTLFTGFILLIFGTGPIKGFATTLVIGICTSLFTAIFITRLIIEWYMNKNKEIKFDTKITRNLFKNTNIKFIENRKMAYVISGIAILISIGSLFVRGLDQGVDFTGGRNYIVKFQKPVDKEDVTKALAVKFGEGTKVITFGSAEQVRITTRYKINEEGIEVDEQIQKELYEALTPFMASGTDYETFNKDYWKESQKVGPTIADDIKRQAVFALFISILFMFFYIFVRFSNWQFGLGAVVALMHDALIVVGAFSLLWGFMPFSLEVDQAFIAAILTVIGYSINDTVIIYDRIREYILLYPKRERKEILNMALNSTLGRTFNTSFTTLIVLIAIFIFGGASIQGFTFGLIIGITVGTYSSVYIATPLVYDTVRSAETVRVLKGKTRS